MKTRYLALYLMLWSVISCVSHASKQSALKEYDIDIQQRDAISDFVDSYKTLPLETTKDNLIGNINKVQIVDTCIYVLDKEQATIFVFNTEGKYLNKICRQGRAPEEYLGLSDFMVYNADVYCLSHANQKIFVYNMQGDWERTIALDDGYERFYIQDDNTFYDGFYFQAAVPGRGEKGMITGTGADLYPKELYFTPHSARILWQDQSYLVTFVELVHGYVRFSLHENCRNTTNPYQGNAVIAVYNEAGDILWSWHIWVNNGIKDIKYDNLSYVDPETSKNASLSGVRIMNMNLGATKASWADSNDDPLPCY